MSSHFLALAAAGALCAGCSAPPTETALSLDNPASAAAASVPFMRPVNVLATGETPATASPSTAMHMSGGAMPGMKMTQTPQPSGTRAAERRVRRTASTSADTGHAAQAMPGMDQGTMPGMAMPGQPQ